MSAQKSEDLESVGKVLYRPVELDKETTPLQGNPAVPATTPADDIKLESIKDLLTSKESSQDGLRSLTVNKLSKSKSNEDANVSDSLVLMNLQTSKPVPVLPQPDITPSFEVTPKPEIEQEEEKDVEKETYEEDSGLRLLEETTTEARRSRWLVYEDGDNIHHPKVAASTSKKKEISWNDDEYFKDIDLKGDGERSQMLLLERKASLGPCKSKNRFSGASGLMLCVPKKSTKSLTETIRKRDSAQGINITISAKKCMDSKIPKTILEDSTFKINNQPSHEKRAVKVDVDIPYLKVFSMVKGTFDVVRHKIYNTFVN